ncbi:hypothetical protein D9M69_684810 [compost metagenome]
MCLQVRIELELVGQFVQVGALGRLLVVHQHHAGQVHLGGHARCGRRLGDFGGVQRALHLGIQPCLQLRVVGMPGDLGVDGLLLLLVNAAIRLGRGDQRAKDGQAVVLGLGAFQLVDGA